LKSKFLLSVLALVSAGFMPLAATSQIAPDRGAAPAERAEPSFKYEIYAGYGYTSINQVNQSRHGLQGVNVSVTRDFGKYFGITADGAFYQYPLGTGNPTKPTVDYFLAGPVLHANLYGKTDVFVHVLLGGAHLGNVSAVPNISFASGMGGGVDYLLSKHLSLRAAGDDIESAFVEDPNHLGYSAHDHWNARATFGVVYKF
jgi:hypothetical protein